MLQGCGIEPKLSLFPKYMAVIIAKTAKTNVELQRMP